MFKGSFRCPLNRKGKDVRGLQENWALDHALFSQGFHRFGRLTQQIPKNFLGVLAEDGRGELHLSRCFGELDRNTHHFQDARFRMIDFDHHIAVQDLAVRAVLNRDKEAAFHACALDPLTAAVVSLPDIRRMFEELWAAEGDRLSYFDA